MIQLSSGNLATGHSSLACVGVIREGEGEREKAREGKEEWVEGPPTSPSSITPATQATFAGMLTYQRILGVKCSQLSLLHLPVAWEEKKIWAIREDI